MPPFYQATSIQAETVDTKNEKIPVSVTPFSASEPTSVAKSKQVPRPAPPFDPFAPLCNPVTPDPFASHPEEYIAEPKTGNKDDLGITDWADTQFASYWTGQTDHAKSIWAQTDEMRDQGEKLHWYRVITANDNSNYKSVNMSARNGPEACLKCEIWLGKGWASSWEYIGPDPPCLPFKYHYLLLDRGYAVRVVARTERDAIAMVDSVCGPGHVLTCVRTNQGPDSNILLKHKAKWREFLELQCGLSQEQKNAKLSTDKQQNNEEK